MSVPKTYDTVTEAMKDLKDRGYTTQFERFTEKERLVCRSLSLELSPEEFEIDEVYRFEGMTDPGDQMILMAISSDKHNVKGVVLNAFGTYADRLTNKITRKLRFNKD